MGVSEDTKRLENSGNQGRRTTQEVHKHIRGRGVIGNIALGMTDGLVTNLAFLAGFAGANYGVSVIRFAGLAAMLAGGVSMSFGGFLAARSERDLFRSDVKREAHEIEYEPEEEKSELKNFYIEKGLTDKEATLVVERIAQDKTVWLQDILTHELHLDEKKLENPVKIALVTGLSFVIGAFVPLSAYLLNLSRTLSIELSIVSSLIFLFVAGWWKGHLIKGKAWKSGFEMLGVGIVASALLYLIGTLLGFV